MQTCAYCGGNLDPETIEERSRTFTPSVLVGLPLRDARSILYGLGFGDPAFDPPQNHAAPPYTVIAASLPDPGNGCVVLTLSNGALEPKPWYKKRVRFE